MWLHEAEQQLPNRRGGGHPPDKELCKGVQVDRQVDVGDGSVLQVNGGCWRCSAKKSLIVCLLSCAAVDASVA